MIHCAPSFSAQALALHSLYMALCSVFLAYLFLKFDHSNQENIVIKF